MKYRTFDELPDVLTIREVAEFMRVSAAVAYEMAHRYRETGGREGLPCFGAGARLLRVSKIEFAKFLAGDLGHGSRAAS